jgi:phosphoglycerate dehydrogenase-like enzyme
MSKFRVALSGDFLDEQGQVAFGDIGLDLLDQAAERVAYHFLAEIPPAITAEQIAEVDGLILCGLRADASTFARGADRLTVIGRYGVGYDTVDVAACTANDVALFTTPPASRHAMAAASLAYILTLGKRLVWKDQRLREGRWRDQRGLIGDDLPGKTLGIVGLGNIGRELARLVAPFGMRIVAHDPYVDPALARELNVELLPLHGVMRQADFLSVHCALTDETRGMLDGDALECLKPSAYLINLARGPIVDQRALTELLQARKIAAAALDVFEYEPIAPDDPLLQLDNVLLTPHSAGMTKDFLRAMGEIDCRGMLAAARGEVPEHVVNQEVLVRPGFQAKLARWRPTP